MFIQTGIFPHPNISSCCIDKRSSAELSEAINSMYRWYESAAVCYVYLADVSSAPDSEQGLLEFRNSRWFTRGWTLQELLAPRNVLFFSQSWTHLGNRENLQTLISGITGIETDFLLGQDLEFASVAKKMSWAAYRNTSRIEDIAYCLLGIFDVNMPLLYGEGKKSFLRLQEEVYRASGDDSIFSWGSPYKLDSFLRTKSPSLDNRRSRGSETSQGKTHLTADEPLLGLLADSPKAFKDNGNIMRLRSFESIGVPPVFFGGGVRIGLPIAKQRLPDGNLVSLPWLKEASVAILGCRMEREHQTIIGLLLRPWGGKFFARCGNPILLRTDSYDFWDKDDPYLEKQIKVLDIKAPKHHPKYMISLSQIPYAATGYALSRVRSNQGTKWNKRDYVLECNDGVDALLAAFVFKANAKQAFTVILARGTRGEWRKYMEDNIQNLPVDSSDPYGWKLARQLAGDAEPQGLLVICAPLDIELSLQDASRMDGYSSSKSTPFKEEVGFDRRAIANVMQSSRICWLQENGSMNREFRMDDLRVKVKLDWMKAPTVNSENTTVEIEVL